MLYAYNMHDSFNYQNFNIIGGFIMSITRCFVSGNLKTKFNAEYIDSANANVGNHKFSDYANYVFFYFPNFFDSDEGNSHILVTRQKINATKSKFREYAEKLLKTTSDSDNLNKACDMTWTTSELGMNWNEIIENFYKKFIKINKINNIKNKKDCLVLALTKNDWKKIKSKIKPSKSKTDPSELYDENYDGSDLDFVELITN